MLEHEEPIKYRGRLVTAADMRFLRDLIARHPKASRFALSRLVCEAWGWRQANGHLREMVCRSLMLHLHRLGVIRLPPPRWTPPNNVVARRAAPPVKVDETPLGCSLQELAPLTILQVRRTQKERLFDSLLHRFHYLGYKRPVGAHLKHLVLAGDRPVACVLWSSAPRHLGPRDRFIGWSAQARRHNVHLLAYNPRYLILPWVRVPHLASHLLGRMARMLPRAWEEVYGHRLLYLETFVDPSRFAGTCYRAANWIVLGRTTGRGNNAPTREPRVPVKEILGYPLSRRFREELSRIP